VIALKDHKKINTLFKKLYLKAFSPSFCAANHIPLTSFFFSNKNVEKNVWKIYQ